MRALQRFNISILMIGILVLSKSVVFAGVDEADEAAETPTPLVAAPKRPEGGGPTDPNASNSFLVTSEDAPEIDKEAVFHRWARRNLADNRSVRDLRFGPIFESFSSILPPIRDWMMCGEFNAKSQGGGYAGITGFIFVLRQDDAGKWYIPIGWSERHAHYREHCLKFEKNG